jgi:hypothetical protein
VADVLLPCEEQAFEGGVSISQSREEVGLTNMYRSYPHLTHWKTLMMNLLMGEIFSTPHSLIALPLYETSEEFLLRGQ